MYKEKSLRKTLAIFTVSAPKTCIPKEFKTFHFTHAAEDLFNKAEELNSELYCRVD